MARFPSLLGTRSLVLLLILALLFLTNLGMAEAARGAPGSAEFGIGAALYPQGAHLEEGLEMAAELELDWLYVPVSWARMQPDQSADPSFETLDRIFAWAGEGDTAVVVSLSDAPAWAQTGQGPDPALAARFVAALHARYPGTLQAVELFPRANTSAGWGGPADPAAYFHLFQQVDAHLRGLQSPPLLVAAGLQPLGAVRAAGDMDDLEFLDGLYALGAGSLMPVISLQYAELTGDPLTFPTSAEPRVMRHYEDVRSRMVKNNHYTGSIWITRICLPSGKIEASDSAYLDITAQAAWMTQLYIQSRSQLYVGVTIGQSLNIEPEELAAGVPSLLLGDGTVHPFYSVLREMISLNMAGSVTIKPGRPKEGNFTKKRP